VSEAPSVGAGGEQDLPESLKLVVEAIDEVKGLGLLVLDVRELASFTDFMVLCSGRGDRHVQAIVDAIVDKLARRKVKPLHTEGYEQAGWVLVDYVDFLVNVFTPAKRDFYQLERVWRDAPVRAGERQDTDRRAETEEEDVAGERPASVAEAGTGE
jgi:ribosome-associated protein